jgi:very-short-patch-repair endonuclease
MRQVGGWKFRRQHPIGPYFVDFYCPAARLVVQIVSSTTEASPPWADDHARRAAIAADGYRVVEVHAADVEADLDGVIDAIDRELRAAGSSVSRHARRGEVQARPWASRSGQPHERQGYGRRE